MSDDNAINEQENLRKARDHIVSSTNLLIFIFLLILVILTIWLFKHKRLSFVHETGLAIFYGAIFGAIIRYGISYSKKNYLTVEVNNFTVSNDLENLPSYVYLTTNQTRSFVYVYKEPLSRIQNELRDYEEKATFDPELFFNFLLPPIIFHAGYSMKRKSFFKNFGAILLFALIGTIISCFAIGGIIYGIASSISSVKSYFTFSDCLLFGAIISATDPVTTLAIFSDQNVDPNLYALIFGESVLNDAVSIVLSEQIEKYSNTFKQTSFDAGNFFKAILDFFVIFLGSFAIGSSMGCANALLTKFTQIKQHTTLETALFILISYSAFLAAEAAEFTGIVAVLFCGVFQAHYTYNNLSEASQIQTREVFLKNDNFSDSFIEFNLFRIKFFHLLNFLSENFIFIYIGITMFTFRNHDWQFSFISASFAAILVGRALNIYPLSFLINLSRPKDRQIEYNSQHFMLFSGLRGAVAFALSIRNTSTNARQLILTTTSVIVIVTVIFCGGLTRKMVQVLKIKVFENPTENIAKKEKIKKPKSKFKQFLHKFAVFSIWHGFDKKYMKPFLTNCRPTLIDVLPARLQTFARFFTTKEQIDANYVISDKNPLMDENQSQEETQNQILDEVQMDEVA